MAITEHAPFGSTGAVVRLLETYRETGLGGAPITVSLVGRLGYGDEVSRRVVATMQTLELVDDDGKPTDELLAFKQAPSSEYKQVLAKHLLQVYAPIFAITGANIADKSNAEIEDAFRPYKPESLRKRMVALFVGLCGYVGITDQPPRLNTNRASRPSRPSKRQAQAQSPVADTERAPAPSEPQGGSLDVARARYVDLLISKVEAMDTVDAELFDRIERVLGVTTPGGGELDA